MDLDAFTDYTLWDLLDDVAFCVKDLEGRFLWVNLTLVQQAQASREAMLGTLDSDWFFNELASVYMEDDASLLRDQRPIINKPELVMSPDGEVAWCSTSKFVFRGQGGAVAGTYGMSRPMDSTGELPVDYLDLSRIVSTAKKQMPSGVTVEALARSAHVSVSTLERTVRRHLRITPQQLLQRISMNRARHLLNASTLKVGEIAHACGYESFSAFSRAFKKTYGRAPGTVRS